MQNTALNPTQPPPCHTLGCLPAAVVGDIRASMLEEVDFRKEAQHLAEFEGYLERARLRGVATCPGVYRQFSTQRCAAGRGPLGQLDCFAGQGVGQGGGEWQDVVAPGGMA